VAARACGTPAATYRRWQIHRGGAAITETGGRTRWNHRHHRAACSLAG
jgi:hypothetical protein